MKNRFVGGKVGVQLNKSGGYRLVIKGTLVSWIDGDGVFVMHNTNKLSFFPFENILEISLIQEAKQDEL